MKEYLHGLTGIWRTARRRSVFLMRAALIGLCCLAHSSNPKVFLGAGTEACAGVVRSAEILRQSRPTSITEVETAEVRELLHRFVAEAIVEGNSERAYRELFADTEPSEAEKRFDAIHGTTFGELSRDARASAFAVSWQYEYTFMIVAIGLAANPLDYSSQLEKARHIVDEELAAVRARRHISEAAFYDALDFQTGEPLIRNQKLNLMRTLFDDLRRALCLRYSVENLRKNANQLVLSCSIEKHSVVGGTVFVVNLTPELWIACSARLGPLRIIGLGDTY